MDSNTLGSLVPPSLLVALVGAFAALIGSFLNVVIWRLPRGESIVWPGSACPACRATIAWYDNAPILSWLVLRARCRRCQAPISGRYPMVELLTMALGIACLGVFGPSLEALRAFTLCALLLALTYIDLDHWLLPHALTWPGIVLGVATSMLPGAPGLQDVAMGAAIGFSFFWMIRVMGGRIFGREALGFGDLFLLAMLGAYLGWRPLAPVVFLASLQGSVVGLLLLLGKRLPGQKEEGLDEAGEAGEIEEAPREGQDEDDWEPPAGAMPFGPFLALAGLEMLFFGDLLIGWLAGLMGL